MRELVFEPLGMTKTSVVSAADPHDCTAAPHALDFNGNVTALDPAIERIVDAVAPAGAVWSTVSDVARYIELELRGGAPPERREPQTKIDGNSSYGLGVILAKEYGISVMGHPGNTLGFSSDMFFLPEKGLGVVVLTNLRVANAFLAAVRQRIFELAFGAPERSEQMVATAAKSIDLAVESARSRVRTDAEATSWLEEWVGNYHCAELGAARIARSGTGYRVDFERWGGEIGSETQSDGSKAIVVTSPPWSGSLRLQPDKSGSRFVLNGSQTTYAFARV
jgi:CubicO group peptidase (beta-lactamase class C family)